METKLERITQLSRENPDMVFTSIGHLINIEMLKDCHAKMDKDKAVGIDGVTKEEYSQKLEENLIDLIDRMKRKTYHPNEYTPGSISEIYYVDVPGFDDGGTSYRLFCPGAQLAQINDAVYSQLPDYFREDAFENDVLTKYILFGMDGNNYLWRFFN